MICEFSRQCKQRLWFFSHIGAVRWGLRALLIISDGGNWRRIPFLHGCWASLVCLGSAWSLCVPSGRQSVTFWGLAGMWRTAGSCWECRSGERGQSALGANSSVAKGVGWSSGHSKDLCFHADNGDFLLKTLCCWMWDLCFHCSSHEGEHSAHSLSEGFRCHQPNAFRCSVALRDMGQSAWWWQWVDGWPWWCQWFFPTLTTLYCGNAVLHETGQL